METQDIKKSNRYKKRVKLPVLSILLTILVLNAMFEIIKYKEYETFILFTNDYKAETSESNVSINNYSALINGKQRSIVEYKGIYTTSINYTNCYEVAVITGIVEHCDRENISVELPKDKMDRLLK